VAPAETASCGGGAANQKNKKETPALLAAETSIPKKGIPMKKLMKLLAPSGFASVIALTTALGQPYPGETWNLDENGPALLTGPTIVGYSNGTNRTDPVSGITTLWYHLGGASNAPGDVLLLEPLTLATNDVLRFDGQGVYFFSDREPGNPNPDRADVSLMPQTFNAVVLAEIGPEGTNGVHYIPGPGMPGFDTSGFLPGIQYNIISDVPEPASVVLLLGGAALLGLNVIRRRLRF
jgi:PEP-CTERM motif-containing protein